MRRPVPGGVNAFAREQGQSEGSASVVRPPRGDSLGGNSGRGDVSGAGGS